MMTLYSKLEKHLPREKEVNPEITGKKEEYDFGFNQCKSQYDEVLKRVVVDEVKIKELFSKLPNYDDEIPDEMYHMIENAVEDGDRDFITKMMRISVKKTHEECLKAIANSPDVIRVENIGTTEPN